MTALIVLDSATKLEARHQGAVVIAASHGGIYPAYLAARAGVAAIILNNAGVGKEQAGIAGLSYLDSHGVPAAAVDHWSARIGDGADTLEHGVLSHVNELARQCGCAPGMPVERAARLLGSRPYHPVATPTKAYESRHAFLTQGSAVVVGIDSVSLLEAADENALVVTASHGALLAATGSDSVRVPVRAISFHDAGGGKDGAGYGRLPLLAQRGIAAVTVHGDSARVGCAHSCYEDGIISKTNQRASDLGARPGDTLKSFYSTLLASD